MTTPANDVVDFLVANSIGVLGATSGWGIYLAKEPDAPDTVITVYDTPGNGENVISGVARVSVQIRARGHDYIPTYDKLAEAKDALIGTTEFTANSRRYFGQWIVGGIHSLGYDKNRRAILVANFNLFLEVSDG